MIRPFRAMRTIKRLLTIAEQEALAEGDPDPGAEHVVLAALQLPDGTAEQALGGLGGTTAGLRTAISEHHRQALAAIGISVDAIEAAESSARGRPVLRSKGSAGELLRATQAMVKRTRSGQLLSAHVLAAACEFEQGTFPGALEVMGIDRVELLLAALAAVERTPGASV